MLIEMNDPSDANFVQSSKGQICCTITFENVTGHCDDESSTMSDDANEGEPRNIHSSLLYGVARTALDDRMHGIENRDQHCIADSLLP